MQVYGQLQNATLEILSANPSTSVQGRIWFNSTTLKTMLDDGTTKASLLRNDQSCVLGTSGTALNNIRLNRAGSGVLQFVTANDATAEGALSTSLAQISAKIEGYTFAGKPAAGNAGRTIYVSDQSSLYVDNGSSWQQVGTASGAKNYLGTVNGTNINGSFELNATTGWSLFTTTLTGTLPTGTISAGAASVGTFTTVASGQLAGAYSLNTASAGVWSAGQGVVSDAWTIDLEDQAKILTYKFYYKVNSGAANANFSGTSSNTFAVYIWDTANAQWIQPAGVFGLTQNAGVGLATGTFQTPSNATSFRFAVVAVNASAGAVSMYWDDFFCGPQTAPIGTVVTDWVAYTPVFVGTTTPPSIAYYSRRVGSDLEVRGISTNGTVNGSTASMTLGFNGSSGNVTTLSTLATNQIVGTQAFPSNSGVMGTVLASPNVSVVNFSYNGAATGGSGTPQVGSAVWATGGTIAVEFKVPIAGWASNVQMSSDTDTRVVAASAHVVTGTAVTSGIQINFDTLDYDTHGAVTTGGSWKFIAPMSGIYEVSSMLSSTSTGCNYFLYKNASLYRSLGFNNASSFAGCTTQIQLVAGDFLDMRANVTTTLTFATGGTVAQANFISIKRLSGPAVVAATESINARYFATATSITSSLATISWTNKDFDTHLAMSAGNYTVPVTGKYQINMGLALTAASAAAGNAVDVQLQKNGTVVSEVAPVYQSTQVLLPVVLDDIISCIAGDTIRVQVSSAATTPSIVSSSSKNFFSIARVGN